MENFSGNVQLRHFLQFVAAVHSTIIQLGGLPELISIRLFNEHFVIITFRFSNTVSHLNTTSYFVLVAGRLMVVLLTTLFINLPPLEAVLLSFLSVSFFLLLILSFLLVSLPLPWLAPLSPVLPLPLPLVTHSSTTSSSVHTKLTSLGADGPESVQGILPKTAVNQINPESNSDSKSKLNLISETNFRIKFRIKFRQETGTSQPVSTICAGIVPLQLSGAWQAPGTWQGPGT